MALLSLLLVAIPSLSFSLLFCFYRRIADISFIGSSFLQSCACRYVVSFPFLFSLSPLFSFSCGMVTGSVERQPPSSIFLFFLPLLFLFPSLSLQTSLVYGSNYWSAARFSKTTMETLYQAIIKNKKYQAITRTVIERAIHRYFIRHQTRKSLENKNLKN